MFKCLLLRSYTYDYIQAVHECSLDGHLQTRFFCSDIIAMAGLSLTLDLMRKLFQNFSYFKPLRQLKSNYPWMLILTVSVYFIYNIIVITLPLVGPFELKYLILSNSCGKVLIARVSLNSAYIFFPDYNETSKSVQSYNCLCCSTQYCYYEEGTFRWTRWAGWCTTTDATVWWTTGWTRDQSPLCKYIFLKIKHLVLIVWSTSICFEVFWYQYKSKNQIMYEWWDKRYCFFLLLFNHNHLQEIMTTSEWFLFSKLWSWFWTTTGLSWTTQWMLYTVQELLAPPKNLSSLYLFLWSSFYPCGCFFPGLSVPWIFDFLTAPPVLSFTFKELTI